MAVADALAKRDSCEAAAEAYGVVEPPPDLHGI